MVCPGLLGYYAGVRRGLRLGRPAVRMGNQLVFGQGRGFLEFVASH